MTSHRIAFVVDKVNPFYVGGYEGRIWNIAKRLSRSHDYEVRIYTSLQHPSQEIEGVRFVRLLSQDLSPPRNAGRSFLHGSLYALSLTKSPFGTWEPDVIIMEAIPYLHLLSSAHWLQRSRARKILLIDEAWQRYTFLRWPLATLGNMVVRILLREGLESANVAVTVSSVTQRSTVKIFGRNVEVRVLPDGVDSSWRVELSERRDDRALYDFITVGRLVSIKRHKDFIDALARLKSRGRWAGRAVIVGFGALESSLRRRIEDLDLGNDIDLRTDVDDSTLKQLLTSSKVFVLCSEREGFSRATLEAVTTGLPAIVARPKEPEVFGVSDFVREGVNGLYYDVGQIDQLSDRMEELINNPMLRSRLAQQSRRVGPQYDWDKIAGDFHRLIQREIVSSLDGQADRATVSC